MGPHLTKIVNGAAFGDYGDGMTDKAILQELYLQCGDTNDARFGVVDEYVNTSSAFDECLVKNKITWPKNFDIFEGTTGKEGEKPFFDNLTEDQAQAFLQQLRTAMAPERQ